MIKFPDTLYKYRDADNPLHIQALREKYIFVSSPLEFNDPFDCKMPMDFESVAEDSHLQMLFAQKLAILSNVESAKISEYINKVLQSGNLKNKAFLKTLEQEQVKSMAMDLGVFCLSKEPNNLLLWSHYANSHKGFCVGYNPKIILEILGYPTLGPVNYCNIYPLLSAVEDPVKTSYTQVFNKSIDWYYEKEYRYVKSNGANKKYDISQDAIAEIYLGCMISDENETIIKSIRDSNFPKAKLYKYEKSKNRFEMEFNEVI